MLGQSKTAFPRTTRRTGVWAVLALSVGVCVAGRHELAFEVASIRPVAPLPEPERTVREELWDNSWLGHYPVNGGRLRLEYISLRQLIAITYSVRTRQVMGKKDLDAVPFSVEALLPEGADVNRVDEMLKNLLKERFSLKAHMEERKETGLQLVVRTGGAHLRPADPTTKGKGGDLASVLSAKREVLPRGSMALRMGHGSMDELADQLSLQLEVRVADFTGLQGQYEVSIKVAPPMDANDRDLLPRLTDALHGLGLDLKRGTVPVKVVVVDGVSKIPTPN